MATRITEKYVAGEIDKINLYRALNCVGGFYRVQPRNGYCAVDYYKLKEDGELVCLENVQCGTPRECLDYTYSHTSGSYCRERDTIKTRIQAKFIAKVCHYSGNTLLDLAKLTNYRPHNAERFKKHLNTRVPDVKIPNWFRFCLEY